MTKFSRSFDALALAATAGLVLASMAPLSSGTALAAASGGSSSSSTSSSTSGAADIGAAQAKIDAGNYRGAVDVLKAILADQPMNPDALNLMGYSHRKLGNKDKALDYYTQALAADPKHKGANEYLGELYLEMDDLAKAEERLSVLAAACASSCEEYADLKAAIDDFKAKQG